MQTECRPLVIVSAHCYLQFFFFFSPSFQNVAVVLCQHVALSGPVMHNSWNLISWPLEDKQKVKFLCIPRVNLLNILFKANSLIGKWKNYCYEHFSLVLKLQLRPHL